MKFSKLFEPIQICDLNIKNRIVMPPMATQYATEPGLMTEREIAYYAVRARGGVGLIIVGAVVVDENLGRVAPSQLSLDGEKYVLSFNDLANEVHAYGAALAVQLHHAGLQVATLEVTGGRPPIGPSETPCTYLKDVTAKAATREEIAAIVEKYADAAVRAKRAGVDAVEVHAAHGSTLVANFLSPLTNKRTDEYGGDLRGRARFAIEILRRIKEKAGRRFPVIYRLSGSEFVPGGLTIEDTKIIAKMLESEGVDALHITAGHIGFKESYYYTYPPMAMPRGCNVHLAEEVKKVVGVPVIAVGRINDPLLAERILQEGKADLVAMGRALIADPQLPLKAYRGRLEEIRRCIGCLQDCGQPGSNRTRLRCAINAECGREREYKITRAEKRRKVLIAGGGPAGMEAARVAAARGHDVYLYEAASVLGGQLLLASRIPHKAEIANLLDYLTNQLEKLGVAVVVGKEVTPAVVQDLQPDVVIVATGASPLVPPIPGVRGSNVMTAWEALGWRNSKKKCGDRVVVAGGGSVGCEVAEYLSQDGRAVTIIEMLDDVATDMPYSAKFWLLETLSKRGVKILTGHKIEEITAEGVQTLDKNQTKSFVECDTVVLALGAIANSSLAPSLRTVVDEVYQIGDCLKPRRILEAIHEGYRVALTI
jgi:2,4-dienoyl-CoA reductase-like NADH-dependent reductase (Old Yellow Enzyme family)/thioredoxin reductase